MNEKEKDKALEDALASIHKKYGKESAVILNKDLNFEVDSVSTGCFSLDEALGCGGLPRGRIIELFGEESCLSGDTFISYTLRNSKGKNQNSKGGTIERLYNRFHGMEIKGKGNYKRKQTLNSDYLVSSINENNGILKNRIIDVVYCGVKECYKVVTTSGNELTCTKDHKFYVGNGEYLPLSDLSVGSVVYIHNNTTVKGRAPVIRYKEVFVKYHQGKKKKIVNGFTYYRVKKANATYEASKLGLSLEEYVDLLNTEEKNIIDTFWTVPKGYHIHHKNFDPHDDSLENLVLLKGEEHNRIHALNNGDKLNFVVVEDVIKRIEKVGKIKTYDIKCQAPYNNYVANGIVVHNSGKSTLATFLMSQIQKSNGKVALVDAEFAFDAGYARAIGLDTDKLVLSQPSTLEEGMDVVDKLVKSNVVDLIVVDSVASMVPKVELEGEEMLKDSIALQARLMAKALRILTGSIAKSKTIVIFINQTRDKVGVFFGSKSTTPGGKALKFYSSIRIDVKKGEKKEGKNKEVIGYTLKATMVKNKVGYPWRVANFDLYFGDGIDLHADTLDFGEKIDVIKRAGASYSFGEEKLGMGKDQAKKALKDNPELYKKIQDEIRKKIKK